MAGCGSGMGMPGSAYGSDGELTQNLSFRGREQIDSYKTSCV